MSAKKTVLVTGANGFIGKEVVTLLRVSGVNVLAASKHEHSAQFQLDYEQPVQKQLEKFPQIDSIVHLAAAVDFTENTVEQIYQSNVYFVAELAKFSKINDIHLIFASSALVAGQSTELIDNIAQVKPDSPYTKSKWMAEECVRDNGTLHTILRIAGVFGLCGPSHLGLNRAINNLLLNNVPIQIGGGKARRNYIYVKDVAAIIVKAVIDKIEGTYLIAGSEINTIEEMLNSLCDTFLPGQSPVIVQGTEASDQIIVPSRAFTTARNFKDAVNDMYKTSLKQ